MVCKEELAAYRSWTKKGKIDIHAFMQKGSRINQVYVNNCNTSVLVPASGNLPRLTMHNLFPSLNPLWWLWLMCIHCPKETRNGKLKVKYIRTDWRNNLWKNIALYSGIPIFSNPRFFKLPDFSKQFLPPMEEIYMKFTFDVWHPHEIFKVLLSSLHLNGHTSQTQKLEPPSITQ